MEEILNEEVINNDVVENVAEEVVDNKAANMLEAGIGIGLGIAVAYGLYKLVKFGVKKIAVKTVEIAEKHEKATIEDRIVETDCEETNKN